MPLVDHLPPTFPGRARLDTCERTLQRQEEGLQVLDNFAESLRHGLITHDQFEAFCARLNSVIPEPPDVCDTAAIADHIDTPTPFYCQGPLLASHAGVVLSRMMELEGLLFARLGRPPTGSEYDAARYHWELGLAGARYRLVLRGRRPFFWVTPTASLPTGAITADRLRDLLGLGHIRRTPGMLMEVRCAVAPGHLLYRPTVLDALDNPTFYPASSPDGWGITDDRSGTRPTPGQPEAVVPAVELECEVVMRGVLTTPPPRF